MIWAKLFFVIEGLGNWVLSLDSLSSNLMGLEERRMRSNRAIAKASGGRSLNFIYEQGN